MRDRLNVSLIEATTKRTFDVEQCDSKSSLKLVTCSKYIYVLHTAKDLEQLMDRYH